MHAVVGMSVLCGVAIASIASVAHAQDPAPVVQGPTSVSSTPSGPAATPPTATPPTATPPVAATPPTAAPATPPSAAPTPVAPAPEPALPPGATSLTTPTPPTAEPSPPIGDPFRPGAPHTGWDEPGTYETVPTTPPRTTTTTTTTTTVVVHERVPPPPPPAPRRDRFFVGGYGGLGFAFGAVSKRMASFSHLRGGILLGERISIGASFTRMTKRFGPPIEGLSGASYQLAMAYGGLDLGLAIIRRGPFELGVATMLGAGSACVETYSRRDRHCVETVKMAIAEPSVFAHFNLTHWMRLGMSGGYRFVAREAWRPPNEFRLAGGFFGAQLEFGWFKRPDTGTRRRARWANG